jgi:ADP-heptose:LPS heptosyltransferase
MKILVLRFSSIGDIVLTSPVLRCVKRQLPGAELHVATKRIFMDLVRYSPYVSVSMRLSTCTTTCVPGG